MQTLETTTKQPESFAGPAFDEDGFLIDPMLWSADLGRALAEQEGVGQLTDKHWRVIEYIRGRFEELGALPSLRRVCRATEIPKGQIYALFGGCRVIWRIAGLPNPGEEAKAYLI